jgi:hypothetical protein
MINTHGLGYGGDVEQAFSSEGVMEALGLYREATCGLILSLSQGLARLAAQVEGASNGRHQGREVSVTLRADCFASKGRLAGRAGITCFAHFGCLDKGLLGCC